jgi:regulator of protease activity HflC (stomatin/prohibitin superfamily)
MDRTDKILSLVSGLILFAIIAGLISGLMWGLPKYRIYRQTLRGEANLREQEWVKKVSIEQAKAEKESAILKADAEVARARGVAEANTIIGESLKNNEGYLRYLWINQLQSGEGKEVIYIPTEAGLPILEAGKR